VLLLLLTLTVGCSSSVVTVNGCTPGMQQRYSDTLYFGTNSPDGAVTPAQWTRFLESEVTPRFPDGFTWWAAHGQWRGASGVVEREDSYVLEIIHPRGRGDDAAVRAIIDAYKQMFHQEAVLQERESSCVAF
jgi:hypothetical protein